MTRRTQSQWQALIEEQTASGLSATEFCKQRDINSKYFSLRKQKLAQASPQARASNFSTLNVHPSAWIEVMTKDATVRVPSAQSPQWLAGFVKALS